MKYEIYAPAQDRVLSAFDAKDLLVAYKRFNRYAKNKGGASLIDGTVTGAIKWRIPATKKTPEMEIVLREV